MGDLPDCPYDPVIEDFGTVLECMDGRPLSKVAAYLAASFGVRHVDTITTAGLVKHLASDTEQTSTLLANLDVSLTSHGSRHVAVVAHHDCAGNPVSGEEQREQVAQAVARLAEIHPDPEIVGLWVDEHWTLEEVERR